MSSKNPFCISWFFENGFEDEKKSGDGIRGNILPLSS
jgi:hypothetical protein